MSEPILTETEKRLVQLGLRLLKKVGGFERRQVLSEGVMVWAGPNLGITWAEIDRCIELYEGDTVSWRMEHQNLLVSYCATLELASWARRRSETGSLLALLAHEPARRLHGKTLFLRGFKFEATMELLGSEGISEAEDLERQLAA